MANQVIKKDGTKEPFDAGKIRRAIEGAARDAELTEDQVSATAGQVFDAVMALAGGKEEIATAELKEKILSELDKVQPAVAEAWRKYNA